MKSILTHDPDKCYFCHAPKWTDHIIISTFPQYERAAIADGLTVPVCWECNVKLHAHSRWSQRMMRQLHEAAQLAWEEAHPGEVFERRFGRNFL